MSESHDDRLLRARVRNLVARTNVAAIELAILLSVFESISRTSQLLDKGGVVHDMELPGVPDPTTLFAKEEDMSTLEAVQLLQEFLDMSTEGQARLWSVLKLDLADED